MLCLFNLPEPFFRWSIRWCWCWWCPQMNLSSLRAELWQGVKPLPTAPPLAVLTLPLTVEVSGGCCSGQGPSDTSQLSADSH